MAVTTSPFLRFISGIAATAMVLTGGALVATPALAASSGLPPEVVTAANLAGEPGVPDKSAAWTKVNSASSVPGRYAILPHPDKGAVLELETVGGPPSVGTAVKVAHYFGSGSYPSIDSDATTVGSDAEATIPLADFLADPVTLKYEAPTYISMQLELYHGDNRDVWLYQLAPVSPLWQQYDFNADANWFTYDTILDPSGSPYKIGTKEVKANTRISSLNDLIDVMALQGDSLRLAGVGLNKGRDTNATAGGLVRISSFEFLGQEFTFAAAPAKPSAPVAELTGDGQFGVTWSAPADGGSAITEYTVTLTPTTGSSSPLVATVGGDDTSHVFDGLTAALSYTAAVTATNSAGTSAESDASNLVRANIQLCEALTDGGHSTNLLKNSWKTTGTGSLGHNVYVDGGLHVWTDPFVPADSSKAKASGYKSVTPIALAQLGEPSIEFANYEGTRPSIQLRVKTGGFGNGNYVVGEPWANGEWMWWSNTNFGVGAGLGYASLGTLTDYLAANPNAVVNQIGYSLGSGVLGDATIKSITAGCAKYTFGLAPIVQPGTATISGDVVFGSVLTVNPGNDWTPTDATFTYQWYRDGVSVGNSGKTTTYTPVAADIDKKLTVVVTGTKTGYSAASVTTAPTEIVALASMAGQASITGTTVVGDTLTAVPGAWTPSNATFTYQWLRNGVAISGATADNYALKAADMRSTITVAISGSAANHSPATFTSAPTAAVTVPAVIEQCTTVDAGPLSTNVDNNGWTFGDTRATGHNDYVADGLHVWTEGGTSTDKAAGYHSLDIPLVDVGDITMDLSNGVDGLPSLQLVIDLAGDGSWSGILVNEGDINGEGMWWATRPGFGVPAGLGYDSLGTLDEYIAANPNAKVMGFGYSLGSGLKGSAVIHSITVGCAKYAFEGRIVGITPVISGTPTVDQVLTADGAESDWTPAGLAFAYQWLRDGSPITDATDVAYTLNVADQGAKLSVSATGSKPGYADVTKSSLETDTIAKATFITVMPVIDGTAQVGQNLTATDPAWTPAAESMGYQWYVDGAAVNGATSSVYTVAPGDLGKKITFIVTGTKPGYTTATATSLEAGPATAGTMTVSAPVVTGIEKVGETLTAAGSVSVPAGGAVTYEWFRGVVSVSNDAIYTLTAADEGEELTVTATSVLAGYATATESTTIDAIGLGTMTVSAPVVTGIEKVGETLTAAGSVSVPAGGAVTYEWFRDGVSVSNGAAYVLTADDEGKVLTFTATATLAGYQATMDFATTGRIGLGTLVSQVPLLDPSTTVKVGDTITASPRVWGPGHVDLTYKWYANGVQITGASGSAYTIAGEHYNSKISVKVTGVKAGYSTVTRTSGETGYVQRAAQTSGAVSITGKATSWSKLTASVIGWSPADAQLNYQWHRDGKLVPGATGSTYILGGADVGARMTVTVSGEKVGYGLAQKVSAPTAKVTWAPKVTRIQGKDRYATAISISKAGFSTAPIVFVATGSDFPDALSAAPVAAKQGGPLLLTTKNALPTAVANEIKRLKPSKIVVVGGSGAVSNAVVNQLKKIASTERVSGIDRYATSRNINTHAKYGFKTATKAYVATGLMFPDALSASAAGAAIGAPVILVNGSAKALDAATKSQLTKLKVKKAIIAGGKGAVSTGIANGLKTATGATADRRGGSDRYETSRLIGADVFAPAKSVYLATGVEFPDALAGAVLAGKNKGPLYLVQPTCVPKATLNAITKAAPSGVTLFGGKGALSSNVYNLKACK